MIAKKWSTTAARPCHLSYKACRERVTSLVVATQAWPPCGAVHGDRGIIDKGLSECAQWASRAIKWLLSNSKEKT